MQSNWTMNGSNVKTFSKVSNPYLKKRDHCHPSNNQKQSKRALHHHESQKKSTNSFTCRRKPLFMDDFGSRLISQLIGCKTFQSKLINDQRDRCDSNSAKSSHTNENNGHTTSHSASAVTTNTNCAKLEGGDHLQFYWRTKWFPLSSLLLP